MNEQEAFKKWSEQHFSHRGIGMEVQKAAWKDLVGMILNGDFHIKINYHDVDDFYRDKEKQFGCFYNCQIYNSCVLDNLGRGDSCDRSHLITKREDCPRWRQIEE